MRINKKELQNAFNSGERFFLDYLRDNVIQQLGNTKREEYLKALYNSVSWLQECLWYHEEMGVDTKYNIFDTYFDLRDKLLQELNLEKGVE